MKLIEEIKEVFIELSDSAQSGLSDDFKKAREEVFTKKTVRFTLYFEN